MNYSFLLVPFILLSTLQAQVVDAPHDEPNEVPNLSASELTIRQGVILLAQLYDCLSKIDSPQKVNQSISKIIDIQQKLTLWGQAMNALPQESEEAQELLEKAYMPIIDKLNKQLQIQSLRLQSAQYYDSKQLPLVLAELVNSLQ